MSSRPRFAWSYGEEDIIHVAVTLLFGIARNHPFLQGNKRTGFTAAAVAIIKVIDGELDERTFADFFRAFVE